MYQQQLMSFINSPVYFKLARSKHSNKEPHNPKGRRWYPMLIERVTAAAWMGVVFYSNSILLHFLLIMFSWLQFLQVCITETTTKSETHVNAGPFKVLSTQKYIVERAMKLTLCCFFNQVSSNFDKVNSIDNSRSCETSNLSSTGSKIDHLVVERQ